MKSEHKNIDPFAHKQIIYKIHDWALFDHRIVTIKEIEDDRVTSVSTGYITTGGLINPTPLRLFLINQRTLNACVGFVCIYPKCHATTSIRGFFNGVKCKIKKFRVVTLWLYSPS